jgi:hypothetical protein
LQAAARTTNTCCVIISSKQHCKACIAKDVERITTYLLLPELYYVWWDEERYELAYGEIA